MNTDRDKQILICGSQMVRVLAKCFAVVLTLWVATFTQAHADADAHWQAECIAGVEGNGGRGSNAANAYCGCMAKTSVQFSGDPAGMLAVMASPMEGKMAAFEAQSVTNKKIISACVMRVEEVYGVAESQGAAATNPPKGIWANPDVIAAILAIDFSASQAKVFKAAATDFSNNLRKATAKILRDDSDTRRRVKKTQRTLLKRLDEKVTTVLGSNQIARYQGFSNILLEKIEESVRLGSGDFLDTSGIPGGHTH